MNESLIKDIGRSYIVSSLLPASFFILLAVFIFRDFLPSLSDITNNNQTVIISSWMLILAFIMWVAFALYSSVDFVFKFFEGYYYPFFMARPLKLIQYWLQQFRIRKLRVYEKKAKKITAIKSKRIRMEKWAELADIVPEVEEQLRAHEMSAPLLTDWHAFLPTSLGNILLASELYPYEKYRLDGPSLFPRMSMLFPREFVDAFEEKNNHVVFLLNSSLLAYMLGMLSLLVGRIGFVDFITGSLLAQLYYQYFEPGFKHIPAASYSIIGLFFMVVGYGIYRISINAIKEYSLFIRTSFDLYRFNLLRELNQPVPTSLESEKLVWLTISQFMLTGERLGEKNFDYQLKPDLRASDPPKKPYS